MPEVQKLREVFRELTGPGRKLPYVSSFPVKVVRSYLHDRIFGEPDGSKTLTKAEAEVFTMFCGNMITRGKLRGELVKIIDSMVEEITDTQIHHVFVGKSMKLLTERTQPSTLDENHPFFNQIQRVIRRAEQQLHDNLVEFQSKMASRQAQLNHEQPSFWFDQNPNDQLHSYPHQDISSLSPVPSASRNGHPDNAIGQGRKSSINLTNTTTHGSLTSTSQPTTMDQTQPSSTYLPITTNQVEDHSMHQAGTVDKGRQFSTKSENPISHAHLRLDFPPNNKRQAPPAPIREPIIIGRSQESSAYPTIITQAQPSFGPVSSNITQTLQGYIGQDQQNSAHPQNWVFPPSAPFSSYGAIQYPQQQAPLYHMVSDTNGQVHFIQAAVPQVWNPYHQSAQPGLHVTPMYTQQAASTFQQPALNFLQPAAVYSGYDQALGYGDISPPMPVPLPGMRPPAHQRLAPLALRSGAFGEPQQGLGFLSNTTSMINSSELRRQQSRVPVPGPSISTINAANMEWYNRFGGQAAPGTTPRSRTTLPYGPGSQIMYPPSNGRTSQELQHLIRNGRPSVAMATDGAMVPFAENAREAVAGEWGVLKVANVSNCSFPDRTTPIASTDVYVVPFKSLFWTSAFQFASLWAYLTCGLPTLPYLDIFPAHPLPALIYPYPKELERPPSAG